MGKKTAGTLVFLLVCLLSLGLTSCAKAPSASDASATGNSSQGNASGASAADSASQSGSPDSSEATSASSSSGADPAESAPALEASAIDPADFPKEISLGFAGDICFADNYIPMQQLAAIGSTDISDGIDPAYIDLMKGMDLMWINNEFAYSDQGAPLDGKMYTFCGSPANAKYLNDLGIDIAGLANNHVFDYGKDAFLDTLQAIKDVGIPYVGAGKDLNEAKAPVYLKAGNLTIAYVAAERAEFDWVMFTPQATDEEPGILHCYDNTLFLESIREAKENADFVIALPHWGLEHTTELEGVQIDGAHAYIDAGADAVIGAHPHILQGIEYYKGKPILYSLGNFWFDNYDIDTMVAELKINTAAGESDGQSAEGAKVELILHPGTQSGVYTKLADTAEWRDRIFRHLESISFGIQIDENGLVHAE